MADQQTDDLELDAPVNPDNVTPRTACVLLLDTSHSMTSTTSDGTSRIDQLNRGYRTFVEALDIDAMARRSVEVEVVTFGGSANVVVPFTEGRALKDLNTPAFFASGSTPLGAALDLALDAVERRKQSYRDAGLEYYRPWIWVITDGAPTDGGAFSLAAARAKAADAARHVAMFGVTVGGGDRSQLQTAMNREVLGLQEDPGAFVEMFEWLSKSLATVTSNSRPSADDASLAANASTDHVALPTPSSWAAL